MKKWSRDAESAFMISDKDIRRRTGRGWGDWLDVLDEWGASNLRLVAIVEYLTEQHHLEQLWAQTVAVYYRLYVRRQETSIGAE